MIALRLTASALVALAGGAVAGGAVAGGAGAVPLPTADPVRFFSGATDSVGSLKQAFSASKPSRVTGIGALRGDGVFVLDQTVRIAGEPVRTRHWELHQIARGRFGGMVSDARGPVTIDAAGNTLTIRYTMQQGGLKVASRITLAPDGRSGENRTVITKWGLTAATMTETISKQ